MNNKKTTDLIREFGRLCFSASLISGLLLLFDFAPRVTQRNGAIENEMTRRRVEVRAKIAGALELITAAWRSLRERRFDVARRESLQRIGIDLRFPIFRFVGFRR